MYRKHRYGAKSTYRHRYTGYGTYGEEQGDPLDGCTVYGAEEPASGQFSPDTVAFLPDGRHQFLASAYPAVLQAVKDGRGEDALVGMRRCLEYEAGFLCSRFCPGAAGSDLFRQTEALASSGVLSEESAAVWHAVRRAANTYGAHVSEWSDPSFSLRAAENALPGFAAETCKFAAAFPDSGAPDTAAYTGVPERQSGTGAAVPQGTPRVTPMLLWQESREGQVSSYAGRPVLLCGRAGTSVPGRFTVTGGDSVGRRLIFVAAEGFAFCPAEGSETEVCGIWTPAAAASVLNGNGGTVRPV